MGIESGGPHEWGYRDLATGEFISDPWPFHAADALQQIAQICRPTYEAARIARKALDPTQP